MYFSKEALEFDKVLNILKRYAKTSIGKSLVEHIKPSTDIKELNEKLNNVSEAVLSLNRFGDLEIFFESINLILSQANKGMLIAPSDFLNILNLIKQVDTTKNYFTELSKENIITTNLLEIIQEFQDVKQLKKLLLKTFDIEGNVLSSSSEELARVRRDISNSEHSIRERLLKIISDKGDMLESSNIVLRDNRLCLSVKSTYKNSIKGILHDRSQTGLTLFIEPSENVSLANKLESLEAEERIIIREILLSIGKTVSAYSMELKINQKALGNLDFIYAKARYAVAFDFSKVEISTSKNTKLINACHPLIARDVCVPIDIYFENNIKSIIITGPNTGGKTVALKTTGLLTLMAMCAMFIPASSSSCIRVYENIFAEIGDSQSIEQSLSTFSSHMKQIVNITNSVNSSSLVLIDELGSGTDPKEGSSLAVAILDYLKQKGAYSIVTTHYTDLKKYAYDNADATNASVVFDLETLSPTYKLVIGVPGKSNAIEISRRLGLSEEILSSARQTFISSMEDIDGKMKKLEEEHEKLQKENESLILERQKYISMQEELELEKAKLKNNEQKIILSAQNKAKKLVEEQKEVISNIMLEIDKIRKENSKLNPKVADLKNDISNMQVNVRHKQNNIQENFKINDYVHIETYNNYGIITKITKNRVTVKIGQFEMQFNKDELKHAKLPTKKVEKKKKKASAGSTPNSSYKLELDLRGVRYVDVVPTLEKFLDGALLRNQETVYIIHGFGTGTVRKAVHEYLKHASFVKSYRFGKEGEGLNGVTVVSL